MKINLNDRAQKELIALRAIMGDHALQHIVNVIISEAYQNKVDPLKEENQHHGNSNFCTK
jgi:hypothetical protein